MNTRRTPIRSHLVAAGIVLGALAVLVLFVWLLFLTKGLLFLALLVVFILCVAYVLVLEKVERYRNRKDFFG